MTPVLHVSQRYPASRLCAAPVLPLARHPRIDSRVIVFDLDGDVDTLLDLDPDTIAARLYVRSADLPEGVARVPLKEIHTNKCPAIVDWAHLRPADFERLGIDVARIEGNAARLRAAAPALAEKVRQVFARGREAAAQPPDVDASLYDGFVGDGDRRRCAEVRATPPGALGTRDFGFQDARLTALLFRYRARNWPGTLTADERLRWDTVRRQRLHDPAGGGELTLERFDAEVAELRRTYADDATRQGLLDALDAWALELRASLG